ncbi:LOW QUALITY PROTEIN: Protein CBG08826 [Caenorhabditis briggsae]|uniref:Nucleolar complex protein 3 homolog n=1 Tax=Caenorhabditis briggsae TaxID=6238 RepID=NOC3L_CAEBR|nr:LOW QUALITY PROTEIN: Protein CBG08826 [Caenorhabditis briggsae]Q61LN7.1 RecName: Full=Nucleolar complex protein 3 homolog; Short=NOC3 protein homolog; AltName: Full=NOC3-like protein; AltName: Full=Nucleolar complex-associated protein 3-like protein [Caenorhabditis briggsae]CAP28584.3 Protein CBG08826 [Caenorhabditis briggsae]
MGFASASREEKLKMMKTNKTRKTTKNLNRLAKKKKLSREIRDGMSDIKARKSADLRQRAVNIEDDFIADREARYENDDEEDLPLDMMDADIDWENSAFANAKRRLDRKRNGGADSDEDEDEDDVETKKRKFAGQLEEGHEELLPIKLKDGTLIRPTREKEVEEQEEEEKSDIDEGEEDEPHKEDFSHLSASELITKRRELLQEFKDTIASHANMLLANPQVNIVRLRDLYNLCNGEKVHSLVREPVQKLAMASTLQVLLDIVPGYAIREQTAEEKSQKQKKETRNLVNFEESLLRYHLKYLQLCEKLSNKLVGKDRHNDENTFTFKMGILSVKALARIVISAPHFNYSTNIISSLVRLSLAKNETVVKEVCDAIRTVFKELHLKITLFTSRSISTLVTKRKGRVSPELLKTLLSMNITEVANEDKKSGKDALIAKKYQIKKERASKTAKKYKKQLARLEADLLEVEAEESLTKKMKHATEAMKFAFQTYFSVLKRMPSSALLEPVLEGLSKFAHLLSIEFYEDIVSTMENMVQNENLKPLDQLHCINTVFVILSGDGQLLNIDPSKFYRLAYRVLNHFPFEKRPEQRKNQIVMAAKTLETMLVTRRKAVPLSRVAAFVKRLLSIATVLDDFPALCIVSLVRSLFIAHPKLSSMIEDEEGGAPGVFRQDIDDPDVANALASDVRDELSMLARRRNVELSRFANNILYGVPSTGIFKLNPQLSSLKPWILMGQLTDNAKEAYDRVETKYLDELEKTAKKRNQTVTPKNINFHISNWLTVAK